jgi:PAS domain S-box-containing protein
MGISPRHQGEWADANCRAVLEAAPDAMLVVNRTGEIVAANQQATKLYGYSREHLIGRVVESLIPARVRDRHRQHRENFFANPEKQAMQVIEIFAVRSDASEIPVDVSLSLLTIGTETFAISAVRDATERRRLEELKRAEAVLRETDKSEERFRLAAQAGRMYAYEWDVATDLVVRSEEQVNVLGFSEPRQLTRQELLARVHPEDRALFVASVDQLTPQYPTTHTSYRVLCPDGSIVWLEKNARGFFDEQGKLLRVIGMVANITERKRVEEALRESEERFRLVANNAPVMIWMSGLDKKPTYFNQLWLDFTGLSETDLRNGLAGIVHPEDYLQCHDDYYRGFDQQQSFRKECRLRRHDGQYRWMLDVGVPRFHKDGSFAGYIGSCIDVTDHKLAEAALANVSGKLIEAQEQERTRIGRELHDDIGQRLAMVAVQLQQFHDDSLVLPEVRNRLGELKKEISGIANDIQSLSHELHSAKLQYLGIAAAMKGFCRDFGDQQKVEVDFQTHDLPSPVPPDTALCLFRVLQEALHNSVKHSGVRHIEVRLWGTSCETHLTVKDSGAGFDREAAKESRGLGLISMEERLKLVKGTLSIESQLKRGTTIHACVPFSLSSDSMRATG